MEETGITPWAAWKRPFGGYSKNLGLEEICGGTLYTLGGTIDNIYRISPRFAVKSGNAKIGLELEATSATYGTLDAGCSEVDTEGSEAVTNIRVLVFALYKF